MSKKKSETKTPAEPQETLRFSAFRIPVVLNKELDDCYGRYRPVPDPKIEYNGCSGVTKASTLFHEMLHFISDQYELDLSEFQVRVMEHAIPQLIRENRDVFGLLLE